MRGTPGRQRRPAGPPRIQAKGDIREILDGLAEKHGATARDVRAAMLSIDDTLSDLLL